MALSKVTIVVLFTQREDDIPLVEWWDADLLPSRGYEDYDRNLPLEQKYREITNLIEHPLPVEPAGYTLFYFNILRLAFFWYVNYCFFLAGVPTKPIPPPVILTKSERKKIRKQRRREVELEKQEKIRFGFMEKPEPKREQRDLEYTCSLLFYIAIPNLKNRGKICNFLA